MSSLKEFSEMIERDFEEISASPKMDRGVAIERVSDYAETLQAHLILLLLYPDSEAVHHWGNGEISGYVERISNIRGSQKQGLKSEDYYEGLYETKKNMTKENFIKYCKKKKKYGPISPENLKKRINEVNFAEILNKVHEAIKKICEQIVNKSYSGIDKILS